MLQLRAVGGAVNDMDPDATAYAHRTQNFSLLASVGGRRRTQIDAWWERLAPHLDGVYLSFETNQAPERIAEAFPAADAGPDPPAQGGLRPCARVRRQLRGRSPGRRTRATMTG